MIRELVDAETAGPETDGPSARDDEHRLTARQLEVAALVARGLTNKAIGARLGISGLTVETHVRNILDRLDATSRTQIVSWWHTEHGAQAAGLD